MDCGLQMNMRGGLWNITAGQLRLIAILSVTLSVWIQGLLVMCVVRGRYAGRHCIRSE